MWQPARLKINGSTKEEKSGHLMAAQSEDGRRATRHEKVSGRLKSFPATGTSREHRESLSVSFLVVRAEHTALSATPRSR